MNTEKIKPLAELKKSGYKQRSVKQECRDNLIDALKNGSTLFS